MIIYEKMNIYDTTSMSIISKAIWLDMVGLMFTEMVLNQTCIQNLLASNETFDLVIIEQFINEAFRGFCHHFDASCIILSTLGPTLWTNPQVANPSPPSYVPDMTVDLSSHMNFFGRLYNSFVTVGRTLLSQLYTFPKQNKLMHKYFPNAPHLSELYYNTSLILLNAHVSTNSPVPLVPNMIEIGGYHVNEPKPLPQDLQKYLDDAKDGAIFFSMGSNLKSEDMAPEKLEAILKVFSKLKQRILWKLETESLPNQPSNVKVGKWLPQQDILAHPNIKLFITHGGLLSTIETLYHGVPVLGIPVYGDQEMNVANAVNGGYALGLPYNQLSEDSFGKALEELLHNPKYTENAKSRSKIMHDQPMKPMDTAIFWVEYVLRHRGAPHLRTAALNLAWYQYLLLDVIGFIVLVALVFACILYKMIVNLCCKKCSEKISRVKKED